jgi:acetone carboxylase gamma subunit
MLPKVIREYKNRNANMIQKYLRGYIDWTKINKVLIDYKLNKHNRFFEKMKIALEKESVDLISRYYL